MSGAARRRDVEEIRTLILGYARATDRAGVDGLKTAEFFTADAIMEAPNRVEEGVEVILKRQSADLAEDEPSAQHTVSGTTVDVDLDAGTAEAVSEFLCTEIHPDGPRTALVGRYVDSLVQQEGRWWIRHRQVQPLV